MYGVTCFSASDCRAVGTTKSLSPSLIEHFDGTSWSIAEQDQGAEYFWGSTCVAEDDCWAVGTALTNKGLIPVILQFSGSGWSPAPSPVVVGGGFLSVSCPSSAECWAAGAQTTGSTEQPLLRFPFSILC